MRSLTYTVHGVVLSAALVISGCSFFSAAPKVAEKVREVEERVQKEVCKLPEEIRKPVREALKKKGIDTSTYCDKSESPVDQEEK